MKHYKRHKRWRPWLPVLKKGDGRVTSEFCVIFVDRRKYPGNVKVVPAVILQDGKVKKPYRGALAKGGR